MELVGLLIGWLFSDQDDEVGRNRYWEHPDFKDEDGWEQIDRRSALHARKNSHDGVSAGDKE